MKEQTKPTARDIISLFLMAICIELLRWSYKVGNDFSKETIMKVFQDKLENLNEKETNS